MPLTWESLAEVAESMGLRIFAQDIREGTSSKLMCANSTFCMLVGVLKK